MPTEDTLLNYSILTSPDPVQVSTPQADSPVDFTIVVSNSTDTLIEVKSISFSLPVGKNAKAFLAKAGGDARKLPGWHFAPDGTVFTATPNTPADGRIGQHGLVFVISGLTVNQESGISHFDITEEAAQPKGKPPAPLAVRNLSIPVAKYPYAFTLGDLRASSDSVKQGGEVTLEWHGGVGATYVLKYDDVVIDKGRDGQPLPATGSYKVEGLMNNPTMFRLVVTYRPPGESLLPPLQRLAYVWVVVPPTPPPVIRRFAPRGCAGSECVIAATEFTLEWEIENAGPRQRQLTRKDSKGVHVVEVPWGQNFILVKPHEQVTEYTMTVQLNDKDPAVSATVNATLAPPVPVGTIAPFGGSSVGDLPPGWFYCDGREVSGTQYPQLAARLQNTYGAPRTSGNVVLPDLRGYFLRGFDDGRNIDPGRRVGSVQDDDFKKHTHGQKVTANEYLGSAIRSDYTRDGQKFGDYDQGVQTYAAGDAAETRPKNIACYFIIYAGVPQPLQLATPDPVEDNDTADADRQQD